MKKIKFIVWMCVLTAPTLLMFTTTNGSIGSLNVLGIIYTVLLLRNFRKLVPGYMIRYIKRIIDVC